MKKIVAKLWIGMLVLVMAGCTRGTNSHNGASTQLQITCQYCKENIPSDVSYCPQCGMKIGANNETQLEDTTENTTNQDNQATQAMCVCQYCNASISSNDSSCPQCGMDITVGDDQTSEDIYWAIWPDYADESWHRFYSYGGTFYIDQQNTWICNVGGVAIAWANNRWTYHSPAGDFFLQYDGSDYFHIDTSDPLYSWNMHSLTGWVQLTSSGMLSCEEPQLFRDNVEALKQSIYDTNLKNKIACFESMGFKCYNEDGTWKCDTYSGILTYDENSRTWYGFVDIYNCEDKTWEIDVEIMVPNASLLYDHYYRYADGRYDEGVGSYDSQTDYSSGFTYNITNMGRPGSDYYQNNEIMVDGKPITDELTGIPNFSGFYICEYNYPVSVWEEDQLPTDFSITMAVNTSTTLTMHKEFKNSFSLSCEYDTACVITEWGAWQTSYYVPRIELTITALKVGTSFVKVYSEDYPNLYHLIEITVIE